MKGLSDLLPAPTLAAVLLLVCTPTKAAACSQRAMSALGHKRTFSPWNMMSSFTPESRHWVEQLGCPLCAKSGLMQCSKKRLLDHLVGGRLQ